ncbi:MAG TPA: hypothetical protein VKP61_17590 [Candidatus Acidoferrum sp.]|nr:hypothetical protein [Candidatus Acidoferrum sp.]
MNRLSASRRANKNQGGYALMLVVFFTALILVACMSIGLRVQTEGRREKEQEMIWRGKQYTRGIKLYYGKFGRFPNSMDDLVKPKLGNLRFMRQAYKDPMNKEDGSWRLIYVGPAGQLIGSLKPQPGGIQMPVAPGQPAAGVGVPAAGSTPLGFGAQPGAAGAVSQPGTATAAPANGAPTTGTGTGAQGTDSTGAADTQNIPMGDTPTIVGGNIIGVGSKVNQKSVIVYEKAANYRLFEFIWDPSKDVGIVSSTGPQIGTPAGTPGQNPMGAQPNPPNQQPNPGPPLSNPNPQQP